MAVPKGQRYGGRQAGTPNRKTQELHELMDKVGCNPFEILILFAKGDYEALGYPKYFFKQIGENVIEELSISPELRQKSAKDACEYLFSKRKAIEHKIEADKEMSLEQYIASLNKERENGSRES